MNNKMKESHLLVSTAIGKKVRQLRKSRGITTEQLAGFLGKSRTLVTMIELGQVTVNAFQILAICRALDIGVDTLFSETRSVDLPSEPIKHEHSWRNVWMTIKRPNRPVESKVIERSCECGKVEKV